MWCSLLALQVSLESIASFDFSFSTLGEEQKKAFQTSISQRLFELDEKIMQIAFIICAIYVIGNPFSDYC